MTEVRIPFMPSFKESMLNDVKICTARTKKYGKVGDHFIAFGVMFQFTIISKRPLAIVAEVFWDDEGAESKEDFIKIWESLHPLAGFLPDKVIWHHWFERVTMGQSLDKEE